MVAASLVANHHKETMDENGGGAMKLYHTDFSASIGVYEKNTKIAMTICGTIVVVKLPSNDLKVAYGEAFRMDDTLADWLARNGKEL